MTMVTATTTSGLLHGDITEPTLGAFFDVYNALGYGFLEAVYRRSMLVALRNRRVEVIAEAPFTVHFAGEPVGDYRADLVVAGRVVVECKSCDHLGATHEAQLFNYLRASGLSVGLLLNFGPAPTFKRFVRTRPLSVIRGHRS